MSVDIYGEYALGSPNLLTYQLAVMNAALQGKPVQFRQLLRNPSEPVPPWLSCSNALNYRWNWSRWTYRIDPASRPRLAVGHNPAGLTEEQVGVKEGWRLLEREEIDPKRSSLPEGSVQMWGENREAKWGTNAHWSADSACCTYRTQQPPGYFLPRKTRVPLNINDLPALCWFQWPNTSTSILTAIGVNGHGLWSDNRTHTMQELCDKGVYYSSDRKTWLPCWREV